MENNQQGLVFLSDLQKEAFVNLIELARKNGDAAISTLLKIIGYGTPNFLNYVSLEQLEALVTNAKSQGPKVTEEIEQKEGE